MDGFETVKKQFTFLRGFFTGANMNQAMEALRYAREAHKGQTRKGTGLPYIAHPLSMACHAISLNIMEEDLFSAILLHDVLEENKDVRRESLPISDRARNIVYLMTIVGEKGESKWTCKERYFNGLLHDPGAVICKALDRFDNLSTMIDDLPADSIEKNVVETSELLLPIMKTAKKEWPKYGNILQALRIELQVINHILDVVHTVTPRKDEIIQKLKDTPVVIREDSKW